MYSQLKNQIAVKQGRKELLCGTSLNSNVNASFLNLYLVSGPRSQDPSVKRNGVKIPGEHRRKENGVSGSFLSYYMPQ